MYTQKWYGFFFCQAWIYKKSLLLDIHLEILLIAVSGTNDFVWSYSQSTGKYDKGDF